MSSILLVDKLQGWTSNDICQFVRRRFRFKKVGHGGTLDPFATGLVILFLDEATRFSGQSLNDEKVYEGTMQLGVETTTGDPEGKVVGISEIPENLDLEILQQVFDLFLGAGLQKPPMASAIKQNGIPLYRLARKGLEVDRKLREIEIYELLVTEWNRPFVSFKSRVSKGTYLRVLAEDIALKLGTKAYLKELRRTESGSFHVNQAVTVDQLKQFNSKEELIPHLMNCESLSIH